MSSTGASIETIPSGFIDFAYLKNRAGSAEGGRALFEEMVNQLVGLEFPGIQGLRSSPGDWGIDGFVGQLDDVVAVWQSKYFIDKFDTSQKSQVTKSLKSLMANADDAGFAVEAWTLCVPIDLDPSAMQWWHRLCRRMEKKYDLVCELWSATQLERRLLRTGAEGVLRHFFPAVGDKPSLRPVAPLPDNNSFEDSLFVAQLQAAEVTQLEPAKVEFFNAEILTRDVLAKKDDAELGELDAARAQVHSQWAHRFDARCTGETEGALPSGLHGQVMEAIEASYNAAGPSRLRSRIIHHFGMAHQLADTGRLGWTRNYEEVAAKYGY